MSKFNRLFGDRLNSLAIKFCTVSSTQSVIKLLNCPRLEELKIYGALPQIRQENFHNFLFTRLRVVSLISSLDYGQVEKDFIKILLKHAPNIDTINIGQSISLWKDFCAVYQTVSESKLRHVGLSGIEGPLEINHFQDLFEKRIILRNVSLLNCLVQQDFLEQFLSKTYQNLTILKVDGTQQEIVSKAFRDIALPNLKQITLPIDGISVSDGNFFLQSAPKLTSLNVIGLFHTYFVFEEGRLISVSMQEKYFSTLFVRDNLQQPLLHEKRREFLKVVSLIPLQPYKLEISLSVSYINSRCFRAIYNKYPELQHLVVVSNSIRECLVGLTGIPYRGCKRMAHCKSFSVLYPGKVRTLPSVSILKSMIVLLLHTN